MRPPCRHRLETRRSKEAGAELRHPSLRVSSSFSSSFSSFPFIRAFLLRVRRLRHVLRASAVFLPLVFPILGKISQLSAKCLARPTFAIARHYTLLVYHPHIWPNLNALTTDKMRELRKKENFLLGVSSVSFTSLFSSLTIDKIRELRMKENFFSWNLERFFIFFSDHR